MPNDTATARRGVFRMDPHRLALVPLDLAPMGFGSPLPLQNHHLINEDEIIGPTIGIWDFAAMLEPFSTDWEGQLSFAGKATSPDRPCRWVHQFAKDLCAALG